MSIENRIQSVDVMRVVAIIAVISIHTVPFADQSHLVGRQWNAATVVNQLARFAVPFFFIVSGYLWAQKFEDERDVYAPTVKMAKRILTLLVAWSLIYLLPTNLVSSFELGRFGLLKQSYWKVVTMVTRPFDTVMQGTQIHLWFLPGLLCGLVITAFLIRHRQQRLLVVLAIALYLVGLAGKAYGDTPLGFHSAFNFRNGPFFSMIFFVTGYFLAQRQAKPVWLPIGILIAVFGILLHFTELFILHSNWGISMSQDYVLGTYFYGLGMAMIALSGSRYLSLERAALIGPLVLGIYASHMVFLDLLSPIAERFAGSAVWSVTYIVAVLVLSYALVRILARFAVTRRFVM
jgi:surface polysaccharide O-acyltransferase-like enzyme